MKINTQNWQDKASENMAKWGLQEVDTLLLAMQEEMGELTKAYLESEYEEGDKDEIKKELDDLGALCIQLRIAVNNEELEE